MIKLQNVPGTIKGFTGKDSHIEPHKPGETPVRISSLQVVLAMDITDCPKAVEALFPQADLAIKTAAGQEENKGWTSTAKTGCGHMLLTVKSTVDDGKKFEVTCTIKAGAQLKVSAQNNKKTNQAELVLRPVGKFNHEQLGMLAGMFNDQVKIWVEQAQQDFFDSSGEAGMDKPKQRGRPPKAKMDEPKPHLKAVTA